MNRNPNGKRSAAGCIVALGLAVLGSTVSDFAIAGCGTYGSATPLPIAWQAAGAPGMMKALYEPGPEKSVLRGDDSDVHHDGIVGMWIVTFTSDGSAYPGPIPLGAPLDYATIQYHSDGTEFQISGARAPASGDVCMGVWKRTGELTYKVKHIALAWASPDDKPPVSPAMFVGPGIFHEEIKLNRAGDAFEGTVTIDQYMPDGVTLIEHIGGTMSGKRFSVD